MPVTHGPDTFNVVTDEPRLTVHLDLDVLNPDVFRSLLFPSPNLNLTGRRSTR
jgi:hypothetical protein